MQAALSASQANAVGGKVAQISIPTPEATRVNVQYDKLYPLTFSQPATYIRFSSTVEDCTGCPYDLDDEDAAFLTSLNKTKDASTQCSEEVFEEVMNCFEDTVQMKQPFAAVGSPPVLPWGEIEPVLEDILEDHAKPFARDIYPHWRLKRLDAGNRGLITSLKVSQTVLVAPPASIADGNAV